MAGQVRVLRRVLLGRTLRSDQLRRTLLPRRLGLPVFASDALSSVAYAPDEILLTLAMAGGAAVLVSSWQVGVAVALVMFVIVASYRQNVRAYPSGGGDYEVVSRNLGSTAGTGVGAALMVDYVLTVAVSVSSAVANAAAAFDWLRGREITAALVLIALLLLANLRGTRESARALAVPVYLFLASLGLLAVVGLVQWWQGTLGRAPSAEWEVQPLPGYEDLGVLAVGVLLLRSFASGSVALTGVQGVTNGVPALRPPRSENAASILLMMAVLSTTILVSVLWLARETGLQLASDPARQLRVDGAPVPEGYRQETVLSQLSGTVFGSASVGLLVVSVATGLMLCVAANTAFNGFPVLTARLAGRGRLPRALAARGARLTYSRGIVLLAVASALLVVAAQAQVTALVHMYVVGVFVSFTLSQIAMIRHWNRQLRLEWDVATRLGLLRSRTVNTVGAVVSVTVLLVVLITRFTAGAGISLVAIALLWCAMSVLRRHHETLQAEVRLDEGTDEAQVVPGRVVAVVYLARLDRPAMRAVACARAIRPAVLEVVAVDVDAEQTGALQAAWEQRGVPVPLRVLESPYREPVRPLLEHVRRLRDDRPRDLVTVYLPEVVSRRRLRALLGDPAPRAMRQALLQVPGVTVVTVPWQAGAPTSAALHHRDPDPTRV